jgi:hypothetical protein
MLAVGQRSRATSRWSGGRSACQGCDGESTFSWPAHTRRSVLSIVNVMLLTPTPNQRSGPAGRKVGRWVLFVVIVPIPIEAVVRRIALHATTVNTVDWRNDDVVVRLAISGGLMVVSVVPAAPWSGELAPLLQGWAGAGARLGWQQPRSRSFGRPSSGSLID